MARNRRVLTLLIVSSAFALNVALEAAAPRFILVTGPLTERPIVLDNWDENLRVMFAVRSPATVNTESLIGRPFYDLALFWGPEWQRYADDGRPTSELKPEQAGQHARFYPALGAAPPIFVFRDIPGPIGNGTRITGLGRSVAADGLELLAQHGVRVRLGTRADLRQSETDLPATRPVPQTAEELVQGGRSRLEITECVPALVGALEDAEQSSEGTGSAGSWRHWCGRCIRSTDPHRYAGLS